MDRPRAPQAGGEPYAAGGPSAPPLATASLGVAVVGTGFGCRTIVPVLRRIPGVTVRVLCGGADRAKTRRLAEQHSIEVWDRSFEEAIALPGLDLVFIASPHAEHRAMVERALDRDLHVVCEKPLALTGRDVGSLVDRSRRTSKLCLVNHQLRFLPAFRAIGDLVRQGELGRPYHARVEFFTPRLAQPGVTWRWWFEPEQGGGMLTAMASHFVDLLQSWFGSDVADVVAHLDPVLESVPTDAGGARRLEAESLVHARLRFAGGVACDLLCTGVSHRETALRVAVLGTDGEIELASPGGVTVHRRRGGDRLRALLAPDDAPPSAAGGSVFERAFGCFAERLVAAIQDGSASAFAGEATSFGDYQYQYRVLEAMRESHRRGVVVEP